MKNHTYGMYEERWYLCDLRKDSYAHGGIGRPILRKTDHFLHYSRMYQNEFINLIYWPCSSCSRDKMRQLRMKHAVQNEVAFHINVSVAGCQIMYDFEIR